MYGPGLVGKLALGFFVWLRAYDHTMVQASQGKLCHDPYETYN